jgi:hypothetical protein
MLVLEVGPGDVVWEALTACQKAAADGALARALSGFLGFVAGRYEEIQGGMAKHLPELREAAARSGSHRRTPELVANLAMGFGLFLVFAESAGAISDDECEELWDRAWAALGDAAASQAHHQAGAEPAQRFIELLRGAIASGRAHLASPKGDKPEVDEGAWGWRRNDYGGNEAQGARVGWLDREGVWLEPDAAYAAVQRLGQEVGDRLAVTPQTLRKRLRERGLLRSVDEVRQTLTVRRSFEGQRREVLHLAAAVLSPPPVREPDQPDRGGRERSAGDPSWSGFRARWSGVVRFHEETRPAKNGHLPADSSELVRLVRSSTHKTRVSGRLSVRSLPPREPAN